MIFRRTVHHTYRTAREKSFFHYLLLLSLIPRSKAGRRRPSHKPRRIISIASSLSPATCFSLSILSSIFSCGWPQCPFPGPPDLTPRTKSAKATERLATLFRPDSLETDGLWIFCISALPPSQRYKFSSNAKAIPDPATAKPVLCFPPFTPLCRTYSSNKPPPARVW